MQYIMRLVLNNENSVNKIILLTQIIELRSASTHINIFVLKI